MAQPIDPARLVPLDLFPDLPVRIELAYARPDNLLFGEMIYRPQARLWLHEDLAAIVLLAARDLQKNHGLNLVVYDGLRTIEAQTKMLETQRVQDNPHWLEEPRLLSPPGTGGHPRGMAVDVALEGSNGLLDMGTAFDYLAENARPAHNPAHREHPGLSPEIRRNRDILTGAMVRAGENLKIPLLPLPEEWWDFRLPRSVYEQYEPLSDAALPPMMRMTDMATADSPDDTPESHFRDLRARLLARIDSV
jgi:D-alanyl-D-alanine dipeptidase